MLGIIRARHCVCPTAPLFFRMIFHLKYTQESESYYNWIQSWGLEYANTVRKHCAILNSSTECMVPYLVWSLTSYVLSPFRNLNIEELFHSQTVRLLTTHHRNVVQSIKVRQCLEIYTITYTLNKLLLPKGQAVNNYTQLFE